MTPRYGSDHANKAAVRTAPAPAPPAVAGLAAVCVAACPPVMDVCTARLFHVAVAEKKQNNSAPS